ncbi:putative Acid phosphatase [Helianthus annuus]|nr:putative Acid phosphatase [Helianthus annuus]KAJ0687393.1 putative Acid phosphatase [Helianthus annuus]KAJ0691185.1 putative Acid phosphatase [Helianthus annuus]KAJ0872870.1 putative Acid phosphatase [Helianthus annuus]
MLGSYAGFGPGSDQYKWLEHDLSRVNRTTTPWLIVVVHAPWYNSNFAHQGEKESVGMRESMEELLYNARVDIDFAGQVLAYERFPQPEISAFREASFGHGESIVASESFASWSWHKNDDDESVQADTLATQSLASDPLCNTDLMF